MDQFLVLGSVFAAVVLAVLGLTQLLGSKPASTGTAPNNPSLSLDDGKDSFLRRLAMAPAKNVDTTDTGTGTLRRQLIQAGYGAPSAVTIYLGSRILLAALLPLANLLVLPLVTASIPVQTMLLIAVGLGLGGYLAPAWWIGWRTSSRQRQVREAFPDALDMLVVCVEAGLGLDAALARVGDELRRSHRLLSGHLRHVGLELRAGRSREDALRSMSDRIGLDEVSSLIGLLIQTDRLGTSMAQALRSYSEDMRARRMLTAEEKAQSLGVKMAFPLMLMILPALFIAIMSPAAIKVIEVLMPMLGKR